jgi:SynChlorMet cassette protein ScmC
MSILMDAGHMDDILIENSHHLKLADGQEWRFVADDALAWLCDDLARITGMRLSLSGGGRTVAFVKDRPWRLSDDHAGTSRGPLSIDRMPEHGWKSLNLKLLEFWSHPDTPYMIGCHRYRRDHLADLVSMQQALYPVISDEIFAGGLPAHAALIERAGQGILIAATGGTGKSTCCRRIPPPWSPLCDDESLIVAAGGNEYHVHPMPTWSEFWHGLSEKTWDVQRHLPLSAIFFLKRGAADEVTPLSRTETSIYLYNYSQDIFHKFKIHLDRETLWAFKEKMLDNASQIAGAVPGYILRATLTGRFWDEIEKVLDGT